MKFLLSVAAVIAVAVAVPTQRGLFVPGPAGPAPAPVAPGPAGPAPAPVAPGPAGPAPAPEFEPIAIGPAIIDSFEPVAIGPAFIEALEGISVGPALVDFPLPDGGAVVVPSPVSIVEGGAATDVAFGTALVQIILNINQAASPVIGAPAIVAEPVQVVDVAPEAVQVVDAAPEAVQVVDAAPEAVQVVDAAPEPVQVIEVAPAPVEAVVIGTPVLPEAAVLIPEQLN